MEFMGSITIECILIQDVNFICDYTDHVRESEPRRRSSSSKDRSQELDWDAIKDPNCVAEPEWQDERTSPWTCTTCKMYVKM
jgi:hypothetical protein